MCADNDRMNGILNNEMFKKYLRKNEECEESRSFCKHNLQHLLDVARIAFIYNLEKGLGFPRDIIYGAALLHDIGKWQQYQRGIPHQIAGAAIAEEILAECGYDKQEIERIKSAILSHRDERPEDDSLDYVIYFADKKSRNCFSCPSLKECSWEEIKKNHRIIY